MFLVTRIYLFGKKYTDCYISTEDVALLNVNAYKALGITPPSFTHMNENEEMYSKRLRFVTNVLFLQPFVKECFNSKTYRENVLNHLYRYGSSHIGVLFLRLELEPPDKEIIDYSWNQKILKLVWTRVEIENAFAWLSTLGGAYSALGDYFEYCAEEAGRIAVRQYKLSRLLGDEALAARSKLYSALSYAQKGKLNISRHIVRHVIDFAIETKDKRLVRMCHGVWAKLKYLRRIKKNSSQTTMKICDKEVNGRV